MKKLILYVALFLSVLGMGYVGGRYSTKEARKLGIDNLIAARDSVKTSTITIAGLQNTVFEKDAIILSKDDAIRTGLLERERLRKLHLKEVATNVELNGIIKVLKDSLALPPDVVFITVKDSSGMSYPAVKIPYEWKYNDNFIALTTGIRLDKRSYFKLDIPFTAELTVGYKKSGFLKATPTGILTTTNPYLTVDRMDVLILKKEEKWFQKTWVKILFGGALVEGLNLAFR
jgi:hypothetical protein